MSAPLSREELDAIEVLAKSPRLDVVPAGVPPPALEAGRAHLWCCFDDEVDDAELGAYAALLDGGERERHARFHFERDRRQFLVTRALVRTTLSRYAPVAPRSWRFSVDAYGKPSIAGPAGVEWPSFNVSHTRGLVCVLVAREHAIVGVDVEMLRADRDLDDLAHRYFAASEAAALLALPPGDRPERFFACWTLKESYIKARGLGLSLPLGEFAFDLAEGQALRFRPEPGSSALSWRFALLRPSPHHLLAVALHASVGVDASVHVARVVPRLSDR
jgi:4'-phosphopantetheinyl transferase